MKFTSLTGAALALLAAGSAQALTVSHIETEGQSASAQLTPGSLGGSLLSADIGFARGATVRFDLTLDAADEGQALGFNAVISALQGFELQNLEVRLSGGAEFAMVGSLTPAFASVAAQSGDAVVQRYQLSPAEGFGIDLGNPFAHAGQSDWQIGSLGLKAGDTVTLSISSAVPEPSSWALLSLGGVGLMGLARRRAKTAR